MNDIADIDLRTTSSQAKFNDILQKVPEHLAQKPIDAWPKNLDQNPR
jgi:hypothetical protein